ncbi:MAG: hypothetical protein R3350_08920, partial [Saprospiraceae bacterium]|nr:hypothetical protein [Saprospiraceae bacterium]
MKAITSLALALIFFTPLLMAQQADKVSLDRKSAMEKEKIKNYIDRDEKELKSFRGLAGDFKQSVREGDLEKAMANRKDVIRVMQREITQNRAELSGIYDEEKAAVDAKEYTPEMPAYRLRRQQ